MAAEEVLQLFDSYWFEQAIFTSKPTLSTPTRSPDLQVHEEPEKAKLSRTPTLIVRSFSDQLLSSKDNFNSETSDSPKSVLGAKLQTIPSGKEIREFSEQAPRKEGVSIATKDRETDGRRRKKKGNSKSLSELEFEEVKGFMDLGFVFSDEDKDSSLVSIIPGLQRLGGTVCDEAEKAAFDESAISRPYLSEAWEGLDQKRKEKDPMMNWRIPAFGDEREVKDHLKFWARTVASTVI